MLKATLPLLYRKGAVPYRASFSKASFVSVASSRSFTSEGASTDVMYTNFSIFKGKAALTISPVLPKFVRLDSGASKLDKKGSVMLRFMPAIGQRKYDGEKKQAFALNPTEVGCLISLGPAESCEFFHDPSLKSSLEGQVKKTLSVKPIPNDHGSYFIGLSVNNSLTKSTEFLSVPVSKAEFTVIRTTFSFILPHLMGWDRVVALPAAGAGLNPLKHAVMQPSPSFEWNR